jgi:heme-degrading monooxygenase HmoA
MMGMRIAVDPKRFEEVANNQAEKMVQISERAKSHGAINHRFYASEAGDEVLIVDEWPDAQSFQTFFSNSPDIGELMADAGVTSAPQPLFWREMDTPDNF